MNQRLLSLDAFRGFTIACMLLVNNPGDWGHLYGPLASSGLSPVNGSLLFAVLFVQVFYLVGLFMYRWQWFIKV